MMSSIRRVTPASLAFALVCLLASPAFAADRDAGDDDWSFSAAAYGWGLSLDGEIDGSDVDLPFHDILDALNFGFMGMFEARRGRWFGFSDVLVAELEGDSRIGATKAKGDVDLWLTKAKLAAGYRLLSHPLGADTDPRRLTIDTYAGGRLWIVNVDFKLQGPILGTRRSSANKWWVDPVAGVRIRADLTDRLVLAAVGDVGGFGIGSASEFTWEAQATVGYRLTDSWSLHLGYRIIGLDREKGDEGLDGTLHGPILGAVYMWGAGTR